MNDDCKVERKKDLVTIQICMLTIEHREGKIEVNTNIRWPKHHNEGKFNSVVDEGQEGKTVGKY